MGCKIQKVQRKHQNISSREALILLDFKNIEIFNPTLSFIAQKMQGATFVYDEAMSKMIAVPNLRNIGKLINDLR